GHRRSLSRSDRRLLGTIAVIPRARQAPSWPRTLPAGRLGRSVTCVADVPSGWHEPSCHGETVAAETTGGGYQNMRKYEMVVILEPSVDERTVSGTFEKLV